MMKWMKRVTALLTAAAFLLAGCEERSELPGSSSLPAPEPVHTATLLAAGDNLIHDVIYQQANRRAGGMGYDFSLPYAQIAPYIQQADVAVLNQETLLAGKVLPPSGYPRFNSPVELGEEMLAVGFDVFNHANNHACDQWEQGIEATLAFWEEHPEATVTGIYRQEAERTAIPLREVNGITFAFLGYTELTNGLTLPYGSSCGVQTFSDLDWVEQQVREAARLADVVVVSAHWGWEGTTRLSPFQEQMAQNLVEWGADLVLGNHSHVLQPGKTLTRSDGTTGFVQYSLGNFISAQLSILNMPSALLEVTFRKEGGVTTMEQSKLIPTVTHYGYGFGDIQVIPLESYPQEMAAVHGIRGTYPQWSLNWLKDWYQLLYPQYFGEAEVSSVNTAPIRRPEPEPEEVPTEEEEESTPGEEEDSLPIEDTEES